MIDRWMISTLIFIFGVYVFGTFTFTKELEHFVQISLVSTLTITTSLIINLIFYYRRKSQKFTISYIFLGLSITSWGIAEVLWAHFEHIGSTTYPSTADLFYALNFVFAILFCMTLIWSWRKSILPQYKIIGILSGLSLIVTYVILSANNLQSDTFVLGGIMTMLSAGLVVSSVITMLFVYKSIHLKQIWVLFSVVFLVNCIADVSYYSSENAGLFAYTDWTNLVWFGSTILLFYALYTHRYTYTK